MLALIPHLFYLDRGGSSLADDILREENQKRTPRDDKDSLIDREKLHTLKLLLLEELLCHLPQLKEVGGVQAIPFMQVLIKIELSESRILSDGDRTEWSPIQSVIIRVITKSDDRAAGIRFVYHEYDCRPNWMTRSVITN